MNLSKLRFLRLFTLGVGVLALGAAGLGCGLMPGRDPGVVLVTATPTPVVIVYGDAEGRVRGVELTRTAEEWRNRREEHSGLIESRGATPTPESTPDADALEQVATARVVEAYSDVGYEGRDHGDWFDPSKGLYFYRDSGGDWTTSRMRTSNPYAPLFYYGGYSDEVADFESGSMQRALARSLSFEVSGLLPGVGSPTPAMVGLIEDRLGWAIRDRKGPVVNIWSSFDLVGLEVGSQQFSVGGVMEMGVSKGGQGDDWYDYLTLGEWIGPVVVERLR